MLQFSDDYNAQTIFDQVWEAPYSWWGPHDSMLPASITELDEDADIVETFTVTAEMMEDAVWKVYKDIISKRTYPAYYLTSNVSFADWISDLDADDVDAILQMAVFGEVRYS